jgi:predicted nucleic acid-binding protein
MTSLIKELDNFNTIFFDTAPVIYYIEANLQFGQIAKEVVDVVRSGRLHAFTSVITLAEVLPKPIESGNEEMARKFEEFIRYGKNFDLIEISADIAKAAGKLRGKYSFLRALDAIQIAAALETESGAFVTNDLALKRVREIKTIVLKEYLSK